MILSYKITIDELSKIGKDYKWPRHHCADCERYMWGHGYVARYFATLLSSVFLKRYRCPGCWIVVTVRPHVYWSKIRSSILSIYETLKFKINSGRWPIQSPRQRGGHWLKRFILFARMEMVTDIAYFLDHCQLKEICFLS